MEQLEHWIHLVELPDRQTISVTSGTVIEKVSVVRIAAGSSLDLPFRMKEAKNCLLRICEVIPDHRKGMDYSYTVYINQERVHVRDVHDSGGGPYLSAFVCLDGYPPSNVYTLKIEVFEGEIYLSDLVLLYDFRKHADDCRLWERQMDFGLLIPMNRPEIKTETMKTFEAAGRIDCFAPRVMFENPFMYNKSCKEEALSEESAMELFQSAYDFFADARFPLEMRFRVDWSGTPTRRKDPDGIPFSDVKYQMITYSETDPVDDPEVKALFENCEDERVREMYLALSEEQKNCLGNAVSRWGGLPWLCMNQEAYKRLVKNEYLRVMKYYSRFRDRKRARNEGSLLKPDFGTGHEMIYITNDARQRKNLLSDFNPAAIKASGYQLVLGKRLTEENRQWLYATMCDFIDFLGRCAYESLERERIIIHDQGVSWPEAMMRHRIRTEAYAYPLYPIQCETYPLIETGITPFTLPGGQWYNCDVYRWLKKQREFGVIANPNLECSGIGVERPGAFLNPPAGYISDYRAQMRMGYAMGCEYIIHYNWHRTEKFDFNQAVSGLAGCFEKYTSAVLEEFSGEAEFTVDEEYSFINFIILDASDRETAARGLNIEILEGSRTCGFRHVPARVTDGQGSRGSEPGHIEDPGECIYFNDFIQLYPGHTYVLRITSPEGKTAAFRLVRIGADLSEERRRSQFIGNARMAEALIRRVREETLCSDVFALQELTGAEQLAREGRFTEAYKTATKADALRFPVRYAVSCRKDTPYRVEPFGFTVSCSREALAEFSVVAYVPGQYVKIRKEGSTPGIEFATEFKEMEIMIENEVLLSIASLS
ncbi:MAG TPA: hypothetical protein DD727_04610 [Clostridiales bacterium]|nr:hypothetical protein [Clostridiales bacterium]